MEAMSEVLEEARMTAPESSKSQLIPLGAIVSISGVSWRVGAVGFVGERYYWLTRGKNEVAMMPAALVETLFDGQNGAAPESRDG